MNTFRARAWVCAAVIMVAGSPATLQAQYFELTGTQHKDIFGYYAQGWIHDRSSVDVLPAGRVFSLDAYDNSTVTLSGGSVEWLAIHHLRPDGPRRVEINSGTVEILFPRVTLKGNEHLSYERTFTMTDLIYYGVQAEPNTVDSVAGAEIALWENSFSDITGGEVSFIQAYGNSNVNISGGSVDRIYASGTCTFTIIGYDFELGEGLSWGQDGQSILGSGLLSGKWYGQTEAWTTRIGKSSGATILAIPEPGTMGLLALGGLLVRRKRTCLKR